MSSSGACDVPVRRAVTSPASPHHTPGHCAPPPNRLCVDDEPHRTGVLGYNPRGGNLIDVMHRFGNCLTRGGPGFGDFLERVDNMEEIDPDGAEVYVGGVPVVVRGTALRVDAAASTPLEDVFRLLAEGNKELLLADETELRADLPADLPVLLRLDAWHQPQDLWDTVPSTHETFRLLAEVLNSSDPARYRPTLPPNTHWSHWPDAGTL
ncbi:MULTISPECIES: DUF7003 family protein [Streptomyces]|uniref:DUF7003 family protein n=1 Tax=Streptomyces TaxID=1883 RepID=UPI0011623588|nr:MULTISPECIES: hypothetical protein [unclassified Streptomyces]NMI59661.1 hypothetical protein [Streptomyces sp. RLA2-12]QDN58918.1 hypothetical protein FNV67_29625 [Streptomyces sp. S1D4-20]QDN68983.1 hypothetical protein FNV66_28640 [Streptomyces sp. S1D4-14]QDN79256.1 hypothetical protein FNV64_30050 [Streptomyces sp. S1A1-7]QDO51401.1 hypothetical protein FNV60_26905 [Streptomyces sp. RLB3-5]